MPYSRAASADLEELLGWQAGQVPGVHKSKSRRKKAKRQAPFPALQGEDDELVEDEGVPGATAYSI